MSQKIDITNIPKFDGSYFHIWKHRLNCYFKMKNFGIWLKKLKLSLSHP